MDAQIITYVVCEKCTKRSSNVAFEINFFTKQINFLCPFCNHNNRMIQHKEATPQPRTIVRKI